MKKTLAILLALSMLLGMGAFCSPSAAAAAATGSDGPVGSYKMTGMAGNTGTNLQIVSSIVEWGVKYYLFLKEDGTGSMSFLEAEIPLKWDENCIILAGKDGKAADPLRIPYTCSDGSLKMTTLAYSLEFSALTEEESAYYKANGSGSLSGMIGKVVQGLVDRMDGGLIEGLLFDLALGTSNYEKKPIPEGEPSEGPVTGTVTGMEFTVLGADRLKYSGTEYIVFYYDVTNRADGMRAVWSYDIDAAQDGGFLEENLEMDSIIPETFNCNLELWPGRTIRCAMAYPFDPDGGTVGLRIGDYGDDSTVLYYADPGSLSGAPEEPFAFDADPSVPEELRALPEESGDVRIEGAELFTDQDGKPAVRFSYRLLNNASDDHYVTPIQDGIELTCIWNDPKHEEEDPEDEDRLRFRACRLRTGSPVVFVVFEEGSGGMATPVAAKIVEIG